jgi:predicted RNase H-like HicB family nuclease
MAQYPEAGGVATVKPTRAYAVIAVIIERGPQNYSAYAPDLPGCFATGATIEEVAQLMREGIPFHLEGLRQNGDPVPPPPTTAIVVEVENADAA